ncbi:MAG: hypothetical protein HYU86_04155 [Chloroflexi bacterium]|nr:hypothetical protein [Chloroflexota bacterium]
MKIAFCQGHSDLSAFRGIGTCELKQVARPDDINQLSEHYLVWYKPNEVKLPGWYVDGSVNYRLCEYVDGLVNESIKMTDEVSSLVQSFKKGLENPVEILVAFDTSHNMAVIVDGTKRALALHYLKHKEPEVLEQLISSRHPIHILQLNSTYCKILFPCDFLKLCLRTQKD